MKKILLSTIMSLFFVASYMNAQNKTVVAIDSKIEETPLPDNPSIKDLDITKLPPTIDDLEKIKELPPLEESKLERSIYFTHGIGGDRSSWTNVCAWVKGNYKARSVLTTYTDASDLAAAASDLHTTIHESNESYAKTIPRENSILIAHSLGGLVMRAVDTYEAPGEFGGIVTFGTPHNGAHIINNKQMAYNVISSAVADFAAGPISNGVNKKLPNNFFFNIFFAKKKVAIMQDLVNLTKEFGTNHLPGFLELFDATNNKISQDFSWQNPGLKALVGNKKTRKVNFYGVEDDPVLWRELYNYIVKKPNDYKIFEADDDVALIQDANKTQANYQDKYVQHINLANSLSTFWNPNQVAAYQLIAANYKTGEIAIGRINDQFRVIIGEVRYVPTGGVICTCQDPLEPGSYTISGGPCDPIATAGQSCSESAELGLVTEASDGAVPVSSGSDYPDAEFSTIMEHSNHQQMRNDSNTGDAMKGLLNGSYGDFFITTPK